MSHILDVEQSLWHAEVVGAGGPLPEGSLQRICNAEAIEKTVCQCAKRRDNDNAKQDDSMYDNVVQDQTMNDPVPIGKQD